MPLHESTRADPILRIRAVAAMFGLCEDTIRRQAARGEFPAPLLLSRGVRPRIGWRRSTLVAHLDKITREAEQRTRQAQTGRVTD